MSDTPVEQAERFFAERGLTAGFIVPTRTGLAKSLMDAHEGIRSWLRDTGLHDFEAQPKGPEHKVVLRADVVFPSARVEVGLSLYRPNTKGGDPRIWPALLKASGVQPGNLIALVRIRHDRVAIINMSNRALLETADRAGSPLRSVLEEAAREVREAPTSVNLVSTSGGAGSMIDAAGVAGVAGGPVDDAGKDRLSLLNELWAFATGGRAVAAAPTDLPKDLPEAARAAGVEQAIEWLREDADSSRSRILFLAGGPGAGKSHAAAAAVAGFSLEPGPDLRLAQRKYTYLSGAGDKLVVINDATIGSGRDKGPLLAAEIGDAIEHGNRMLVCVNRGVIVEELAQIRRGGGADEAGSAVLGWLGATAAASPSAVGLTTPDYVVADLGNLDYLRSALLTQFGEPVAQLVSVSVDACSLLEPTPKVTRSPEATGWFNAAPYRVTALLERPGLDGADTSAGSLLERVIKKATSAEPWATPEGFMDPFAANIESLADPSVRAGLLSVARAAEVVTGTLFTFRDIWGLIVRALVGGATDQVPGSEFVQMLEQLQPTAKAAKDRFREVQRLAGFRLSQGIFGVGADDSAAGEADLANPVVLRLRSVDPVKDAVAGHLSPKSIRTGWATAVMDAFSGLPASGSPLSALGDGIGESDGLPMIVTAFDESLDEEYRKVLSDPRLKDAERHSIVAWYGRYLTRLYAVANGIPAFRREVEAWTRAWDMSPEIPSLLEEYLRTLIRPARTSGVAGSIIPLLESRATPIVDEVPEPKLALKSGSFDLGTRRAGEQLFLHVREEGDESPPTLLDFAMVRQAFSCDAGWIGFTETAETTAPRLERFRSNQLTRPGSSGIVVVTAHGEKKLTIEANR